MAGAWRQTCRLFTEHAGFKLVKAERDGRMDITNIMREMGRSHFCLAPTGGFYEVQCTCESYAGL